MFGRGLRCFDFANQMPFSVILLVGCCFTCDVSLLSLSFSVFLCLSLSFSVFLCLSLSFSVFLCLFLSLSLCLSLSLSLSVSLSLSLSLSPFSVLLCPSLSLSLSVCAYAGAAARRARSLGDAAVFSPQGGGMLVLGAAGLFCLSGGELQAIKENRKQNRLAQKRRKNLLKADIVFCSCLFLGGSSITLRRRQRSYLVLIFSCSSRPKRRKQLRQERRSPQAPAVAVLGLLGQQSKAALNFRRLLKLLTFISSAVQHHHRSLLFLTQAHIVLCHLLVTG